MGQITIEIPQKISRKFRIEASDEAVNEILLQLEKLIREKAVATSEDEEDSFLGLWADRPESAEEIARKLRQGWNRTAKND